jgi:hypothetical protein
MVVRRAIRSNRLGLFAMFEAARKAGAGAAGATEQPCANVPVTP